MQLKGRLALISQKVPKCNIVCDVGTDHAYVPIYLLKRGICEKAIVTDINKGPIHIAQRNIKEHQLDEFIETRIGDGLEPLKDSEVDGIIIAGMGGKLIERILSNGISKAKRAEFLILQPMNSEEIVTSWLYKNKFEIVDEELVKEDSKIYNIKTAKWTGKPNKFNEVELYISNKLINNRNTVLDEYINKKIKMLNNKISGIKLSKSIEENDIENYISLRNEMLKILFRGEK
ncbi:MAG TPA: SAM-dependent methyltransferase [Clostridiaceae bacterium]|jgi:tRNA (adenine22-N1)-methyltransferase|nr:SAM-dependent methyltransferase [Clostridiaceae bacterium]